MKTFRVSLLFALCVLVAVSAHTAQTEPNVRNPSAVEFTPSADHANIDSYELDILRPDNTVLQTINVGKPTPVGTAPSWLATAPLNVQPVTFGIGYSVQIRARAGAALSDNSRSVNKFDRVPGAPSGGRLK